MTGDFCFRSSSINYIKDHLCSHNKPFDSLFHPKAVSKLTRWIFSLPPGLKIFKPNPRQYQAEMPALPELGVIFQRPGDIVVSVRQGSIDFGITGLDMIEEKRGHNGDILILHDALGFGSCALTLAVPEIMENSDRYCIA